MRLGGESVGSAGTTVPIAYRSLSVKRSPGGRNVPLLMVPGSPTVPGGAPRTELGMNADIWPLPTTSAIENGVPTGSNRNGTLRNCQKPSMLQFLLTPRLNDAIGTGRTISLICTPGLWARVRSNGLMMLMPP